MYTHDTIDISLTKHMNPQPIVAVPYYDEDTWFIYQPAGHWFTCIPADNYEGLANSAAVRAHYGQEG